MKNVRKIYRNSRLRRNEVIPCFLVAEGQCASSGSKSSDRTLKGDTEIILGRWYQWRGEAVDHTQTVRWTHTHTHTHRVNLVAFIAVAPPTTRLWSQNIRSQPLSVPVSPLDPNLRSFPGLRVDKFKRFMEWFNSIMTFERAHGSATLSRHWEIFVRNITDSRLYPILFTGTVCLILY